ncbi:MAG TPA: tellurite resistance TerB family protein [Devosia sp.]|nr:tellurite resistance TerB family protein [Devosia sp.]
MGKTLVRAMIAAAKADGGIDATEKEAIFNRLETMQLSSEEKAWVFDELSSPLDINAVAARADTPEHAAEIYAASLVAITADTAAERMYLSALAGKLNLPDTLVAEIHKSAEQAVLAK